MPINIWCNLQSSFRATRNNLSFDCWIFRLYHLFAMSVLLICSVALADTKQELTTAHSQLGGGLILFAATVIDGGGVAVNSRNIRQAVLDISEEFPNIKQDNPKYFIPLGRIQTGKQTAMFSALTERKDEGLNFEIPVNGSRIIAFGSVNTSKSLEVYANYTYSDTQASRAAVALGRAPLKQSVWQRPLFFACIAAALAAIFLPWIRVEAGLAALVVSIGLLMGYNSTIPAHIDIRIDLVLIVPLIVIATISLLIATVRGANKM